MSQGGSFEDRLSFASQLKPLARRNAPEGLERSQPPFISAFVTRRTETVAEFVNPSTSLIVVIEGQKHIESGARCRSLKAGEAFLLQAGARLDVVNEPDGGSGVYRALFFQFPRDLVIEASRLWPEFVGKRDGSGDVRLETHLCTAILHAADALRSASRKVIEHRLLEIVLILAEQGALGLTPKYVQGSVSEALRAITHHRLERNWSASAAAEALGMSEATLRRRLRQEGRSLRELLLSERMKAAHLLLCERNADVAEALAATGYTSRSHFARHFRKAFGLTPAQARQSRHSSR